MSDDQAPTEQAATFRVRVLDLFHYMDEDEEETVSGFATIELAREYARRRTRDSLEDERTKSNGAEDLRDRWYSFGEDCLVMGDSYAGGSEIDYFIAHPANDEERDWVSLTPDLRMREILRRVRRASADDGGQRAP